MCAGTGATLRRRLRSAGARMAGCEWQPDIPPTMMQL